MNYAKIYESLIEKRRKYPLSRGSCYCERHHFIPRCMGGGNELWNLVYLTAKEHFVAHHLLCKCNPKNGKLLNAFIAMCTKKDCQKERSIHISAKRYEALKKAYGKYRREMFAAMTDEQRKARRANIKEGCARRTKEQKAAIKAKMVAYHASLTEEDKKRIAAKCRETIARRSEERKREIFERTSLSHRKMSEKDEFRVVAEYEKGRSASQIASESWCSLGREGVNYLLRRRGIVTHAARRWEGKEEAICRDFAGKRYSSREELAKAYGTSWSVIERILKKNGVAVGKSPAYSRASIERENVRLRKHIVECSTPFSHTVIRSSLFDAIERMRMFGVMKKSDTRRVALRKIRHVLKRGGKFAYGYSWRDVESL